MDPIVLQMQSSAQSAADAEEDEIFIPPTEKERMAECVPCPCLECPLR